MVYHNIVYNVCIYLFHMDMFVHQTDDEYSHIHHRLVIYIKNNNINISQKQGDK